MTMTANTETLTWATFLNAEKEKDYFKKILHFVKAARAVKKHIYPPQNEIFNALKFTPYENVKVVILGQDPYHGHNQAHGMCFSVKKGVSIPPSLQNIYKELHDDIGFQIPNHGNLEKWAQQGVLLLNTVLTVEAGKPQSHAHLGWQQFTDKVITSLNEHPHGIVYLLWGSSAQSKTKLIDTLKHKVLCAPHPSPLSAHRGFLGCKHFSKCNQLLIEMDREPIDWAL